jgi:ABC-type nitrate/sulfonate/bicarbonate transport system substrate-binding protein
MKALNIYITTLLLIVVCLTACAPSTTPIQSLIPITVQLKWVHQAQFAGFYVAADKGYYQEENISITSWTRLPAGGHNLGSLALKRSFLPGVMASQ